jgi:hypothetical protein
MGKWNRLKTIQKVSEQLTGNNDTNILQKTTVLGTAYALRKVSLLKFTTFIMGSIIVYQNFNNIIAAKLYNLETYFASGAYL